MKHVALFLIAVVLVAARTSAQQIPARVKYHRASEVVNAAAAKRVRLVLAGKLTPDQLTRMSTKVLIVGPGLWDTFKKFTKFDKNTGIPVTFYVPYSNGVQKREGRGMKTPAQQRAFWAMFLDTLAVDAYQIRKANAKELDYYWTLISYEIQEPLFVAQFNRIRLLFDMGSLDASSKFFVVDVLPKSANK